MYDNHNDYLEHLSISLVTSAPCTTHFLPNHCDEKGLLLLCGDINFSLVFYECEFKGHAINFFSPSSKWSGYKTKLIVIGSTADVAVTTLVHK